MKRGYLALFIAFTGVLVACGGGGGSAPGTPPMRSGDATAMVTVKITVPGSAPQGATAQLRKRFSQLASTSGIIFTLFPHGNTSTPLAQTAADISATSPASVCATNTSTSRVCTVTFAAPVGSANDLVVQTIDQTPTGGVLPPTFNKLSAALIANVNIVSGITNTITPITLNPIVNSMAMSTTPGSLRSLLPASFTLNANALDADGNLVVGSYVDQFGNPVTINLSMPTNPNASLSLSTTSLTASGTVITGTYNAGAFIAANSNASIGILSSIGGQTLLNIFGPHVVSLTEPNLQVTPGPPGYSGSAYAASYPGANRVIFTTTEGCCGGIDAFDPIAQTLVTAPEPTGSPMIQGGITLNSSTIYYGTTGPQNGDLVYNPSLGAPGTTFCSTNPCYGTSNLAFNSTDTQLYYQGSGAGGLSAYGTSSTAFAQNFASCNSPPCTITGVTWDANTDTVWFIDGGSGGKIYSVAGTGGTVSATSAQAVPYFDADVDSNSVLYVTNPGAKTISLISAPLPGGCCSPVIPVKLGAPRYINVSRYESGPTEVWFTEDTSTGIAIGRYDIATQKIGEASLGTAGGFAGSLQVDTNYGQLVVLHFSGSTSAGEILTVTP
jgi:hypothetical protein